MLNISASVQPRQTSDGQARPAQILALSPSFEMMAMSVAEVAAEYSEYMETDVPSTVFYPGSSLK